MVDQAVMLRAAYHAEAKEFRKHIKQLEESGNG